MRVFGHDSGRLPLTDDIVALLKRMARDNRTWGAERLRGELLKLGVQVSKSTIQKYIYEVRKPGSPQQTWATFLRNHAKEIWACDFLQTYDLFFRSLSVRVADTSSLSWAPDAWSISV